MCQCRAASVVTTMASEFLTIDGKQYQQLLGQLQREELKAKVDVLRRAPMFRSANVPPLSLPPPPPWHGTST